MHLSSPADRVHVPEWSVAFFCRFVAFLESFLPRVSFSDSRIWRKKSARHLLWWATVRPFRPLVGWLLQLFIKLSCSNLLQHLCCSFFQHLNQRYPSWERERQRDFHDECFKTKRQTSQEDIFLIIFPHNHYKDVGKNNERNVKGGWWILEFITMCVDGETTSQINGVDQLRERVWHLLTKVRTVDLEKENFEEIHRHFFRVYHVVIFYKITEWLDSHLL